MGSRGSRSGADLGGGGASNDIAIINPTSLISQREQKQGEVDDVLTVLRDVNNEYGYVVEETVVATLGGKDGPSVMAYYDEVSKTIGVNAKYFDSNTIQAAYDREVGHGFHPGNGNKTGMEATYAHEVGHALNDMAAAKMGVSMDAAAKTIVSEAFNAKNRAAAKASALKISGYATTNNAECIAEAFSDVYCNGSNASAEAQAIVRVLNKYAK